MVIRWSEHKNRETWKAVHCAGLRITQGVPVQPQATLPEANSGLGTFPPSGTNTPHWKNLLPFGADMRVPKRPADFRLVARIRELSSSCL